MQRLFIVLFVLFLIVVALFGVRLWGALQAERDALEIARIPPPRVISTLSFDKSRAGWLVANPNTQQVFAAQEDVPALASIDARTNAIAETIPLGGYHTGMTLDLVKNEIFVTQAFSQTVRVIDGRTSAVLRELPVAGGSPIGELAFDSNDNRLYVIQNDIKTVAILDHRDGKLLGTIPVDAHYGDLALNPQTERLYISSPLDNKITVVDTTNDSIVTTIPLGNNPTRVEVNPATNRIYVTVSNDNVVAVIDGATNALVTTIPVGEGPTDVAVNPFTNRIYVVEGASKALTIIDGATNRVLTSIPLKAQPGRIALLPALNRIYVSSDEGHGVFVIQDTPTSLGTEILLASDGRARGLSIGSDEPPANWKQLEFDDTGWAAAAPVQCVFNTALRLNTEAKWIWPLGCSQREETVLLRQSFDVSSATAQGALRMRAMNTAQVYLNGQELGATRLWTTEYWYDLTPHLRQGRNVLALRVNHKSGYGAVLFEGEVLGR